MRIDIDSLLSALGGGLGGLSRGMQEEDDRRRLNEDRDYRKQRDELSDRRDLTRISVDANRAGLDASIAAERRLREDHDREVAGGALRSGISANRDIPESIRQHFDSLSNRDAGALDASAVSRLFMDPYTKPAAAVDLETLRQGGRQSLADINNAVREAVAQINESGRNARFDQGERGRDQRFERGEAGRNTRQSTQIDASVKRDSTNNAARAQAKSSFDDLLSRYGGGSNRTGGPPGEEPPRLPAVEVNPAPRDQKRQDLDAAIKALRTKGTPKKDWPPAVLRAMRELGVR